MIKKFYQYNESKYYEDYGESFLEDALVSLEDLLGRSIKAYPCYFSIKRNEIVYDAATTGNCYRAYKFTMSIHDMVIPSDYNCSDEFDYKTNELLAFYREIAKLKDKLENFGFEFLSTTRFCSQSYNFTIYYTKQEFKIPDHIEKMGEAVEQVMDYVHGEGRKKYADMGWDFVMEPDADCYILFNLSTKDVFLKHNKKKDIDHIVSYAKENLKDFKQDICLRWKGDVATIREPESNTDYFKEEFTNCTIIAVFYPPKEYFKY